MESMGFSLPCKRCPDRASGYTIGGRRNVGCGRLSERCSKACALYSMIRTTHLEFCSTDIPPGCLTSGILLRRHSIRIFRIRRLTPDGRGERFNFPGQTYPDPLIALTRGVSQPFLHSAVVFS